MNQKIDYLKQNIVDNFELIISLLKFPNDFLNHAYENQVLTQLKYLSIFYKSLGTVSSINHSIKYDE